jgi:type I restriction enzyme S subunit
MVILEGYKQTEVGVIPEEWDLKEWCDVASGFSSGATPYRAISRHYSGNIKWVSSGELNYNIIYDTLEHISAEAKEKTNLTTHPAGTFLMAITGLEAAGTRGRCAILGCDATTNQSCMAIYETDKLHIGYLFHYYVSHGDELAFKFCQGTKQQSYTAKIIKKLPIVVPTLPEQRAIAAILSDADVYITALEKLIAKKRAVKQGAMQELLTGKRRLVGYSGAWLSCGLPGVLVKGDGIKIGPFGSQLRKEYLVQNGDFRVYGQENIYQNDFSFGSRYLTRERFENLQSCEIKPGDFVISTMGTIGKCAIVPPDICVGIMDSHLIRLRIDKSKLLPQYLLHLFSSDLHYLESQTSRLSVGGIMDGLSTKIVCALEIEYPESADEQTTIVEILSDMDAEIDALTVKLGKALRIKQGMMSELLTGRIRLIQEDTYNGEN